MLKKTVTGILILAAVGFARTNQEIIDAGNEKQKAIFDKHFNSSAKSGTIANAAYSETMASLYGENRSYFDREFARLSGNRKSNFRTMYAYYSDYVVEYPKFLKNAFGSFLAEAGEFQSYSYTNTYLVLETFNLNMNTYLEAEKDAKTVDANINAIYDYLYSVGDKVSKEDYKKMSSAQMKALVNEEYDKLERLLDMRGNEGKDKKKAAAAAKSSLKKLRKSYGNYDKWFDDYVDTSSLSYENKEKLKKLAKFENISNIKFIIQSISKKTENK
jgi:protein SFRS12IP1